MPRSIHQATGGRLTAIKRVSLDLSSAALVKEQSLTGAYVPLVLVPALPRVHLFEWAAASRSYLRERLCQSGAILFRGFDVTGPAQFQEFIRTVSGEPLEYGEQSSPRTPVTGNIYTSTEYPAEHWIFMHNENSYRKVWPLKIFFFCESPATKGGETPIADVRRVLSTIDPHIRDRFAEKGVMYVRNFRPGLGVPWQRAFQTENRLEVEQYCSEFDIQCEWRGGDWLTTRQVGHAILRHPETGEEVWFNHAAFFHVSTLDEPTRELLLANFSEEGLPANAYYGDGSRIEFETAQHLRDAYRKQVCMFPWQRGDILMLDNMLVAHGRAPFEGNRRVLVGMSETFTTP